MNRFSPQACLRNVSRTTIGAVFLFVAVVPTLATAEETTTTAPASQTAELQTSLAGSASCRECHEIFHEKWATSFHGTAMQPFTAELAARQLKPLTDPLEIRGRRYLVQFTEDAGLVAESGPEGTKRYPIRHALGGKNVFYFLTPLERGRLQVLPVAYDVRRGEWFDTTGSAARGLMHFEDEVLDWHEAPLTFNSACYGCHVSQFSSNYDPKTDTYRSSWAEAGISCETCHGGGAEHVELFRGLPADARPEDPRIISTKHFSIAQINDLCAPCHAKMASLTASFRPGDRYFDNYDLVGVEHSDYYPDGRDLGENYTFTSWLMSPCVRSGQLSCMHCHTSSGRYRFADNPNGACLPCHQEQVADATTHTHHPADSKGNHCVSCHMPTTEFARMHRSDHSMRPPMPAATLAVGSPNACNVCHTDKDAAWADKQVRIWRPRDYQASTLRVAALVDAARRQDWTKLPDMLAYVTAESSDALFTTALVRLLRACADERKLPALVAALENASPLVRASAAAGLDGILTPQTVQALLAATRDDYRLVRIRAAASLAPFPLEQLPAEARSDLQRATDELLAALQAHPDEAASFHNLGNFYAARGEHDRAVECYERALKLQPDNIAPLVNAAFAHNAVGRNDLAENCLRRALEVEPNSAAANLNLGLLLGELGRSDEAQAALRRAFEVDPTSATAAYNLAVLLAPKHPGEAIEWCRKAAQLRPEEPRYRYLLAFCLQQTDRRDEAIQTLRTITDAGDPYADAYALLGSLYEDGGDRDQAIAVYRQATRNQQFADDVRRGFSMRADLLEDR